MSLLSLSLKLCCVTLEQLMITMCLKPGLNLSTLCMYVQM